MGHNNTYNGTLNKHLTGAKIIEILGGSCWILFF